MIGYFYSKIKIKVSDKREFFLFTQQIIYLCKIKLINFQMYAEKFIPSSLYSEGKKRGRVHQKKIFFTIEQDRFRLFYVCS